MEIDNYQWEILMFNKESIIKNTFKFLVVTIIGFNYFLDDGTDE